LKKIVTVIGLLVVSLLFTGCGNKVSFKAQEPLENAALVYVYVTQNVGTEESMRSSDYSIRINNKRYLERIRGGEFISFNLKPQAMTISATRAQIEEKVLDMDLKAGQIYYLKVRDNLDGGKFDFEMVDNAQGSKEIAKTGLAGSSVESPENIITEFVTGSKSAKEEDMMVAQPTQAHKAPQPVVYTAPKAQPSSKMEDVQKAFKLKEQGILSDAEFQKLKTEILSK
jgi:hypothetical protein